MVYNCNGVSPRRTGGVRTFASCMPLIILIPPVVSVFQTFSGSCVCRAWCFVLLLREFTVMFALTEQLKLEEQTFAKLTRMRMTMITLDVFIRAVFARESFWVDLFNNWAYHCHSSSIG
jgi:hypothetical protein